MPAPLIDPASASDAGAVAGRRGYRYQDHIAASLVLDMMESSEITRIECETADDITVISDVGEQRILEYVQVKTTDADSKWSVKEIIERDAGRVGTSLAERSLACDSHQGTALFRVVSQRELRADLKLFSVPRSKRGALTVGLKKLTDRFGKAHKGFASANGLTLEDWSKRLLWEVAADEEAVRSRNINRIIRLAEEGGEIPGHSQAEAIYRDLLGMVGSAADASRITHPEDKAIDRTAAFDWWQARLSDIRITRTGSLKVYRISTERFFADLHALSGPEAFREMSAYDAEFDRGVWRCEELAEYLLRWLPEVSLPARLLAEYDYLDARSLAREAVSAYERNGTLDDRRLVAELLLHAILRHYHKSEPIACKLFHRAAATSGTSTAHIVHDACGDQLWVGRATLTTATTYDELVRAVVAEMTASLQSDLLRQERELILQLREPRHLTRNDLESVLRPHAKMEDLLRVLRVPVLVAYDSEVIGRGFDPTYLEPLRLEVEEAYQDIKGRFSPAVETAHIHIFLIPIECAETLLSTFSRLLRGS